MKKLLFLFIIVLFSCDVETPIEDNFVVEAFLFQGEDVDDIKIIQRRYEDTHLSEKSFDILISNSVLHHVKSPKKFWEKSFNLVTQEGHIVLMDLFRPSNEHELLTILDKYGGDNPVLLNDFENSLRAAYTPHEVEGQLSSFPSISSSVKAISDRHFFVTIEIKK